MAFPLGAVIGGISSIFGGKSAKKAAQAAQARMEAAMATNPYGGLSNAQRYQLGSTQHQIATEDPQLEAQRQMNFVNADRALGLQRWLEGARDTGIGRFAAGGSSGESGAMTRLMQRGHQDYTKQGDLAALGALNQAHELRRRALQDAIGGAERYTNMMTGGGEAVSAHQAAAGQAMPTSLSDAGKYLNQAQEFPYRMQALQSAYRTPGINPSAVPAPWMDLSVLDRLAAARYKG